MATGEYVLRPRPRSRQLRIDYESELNESQFEAVRHGDGPALVIAGAGTGKTRTLVHRVAWLVEHDVAPSSILLLTFTRRAARQMLDRACALVGPECGDVAGGTFHSFGSRILREMAPEAGLERSFTILDRGDSEDVVQYLRGRLGLDAKERRFPRKNTIVDLLSLSVNRCVALDALVERDAPHLVDHVEDLLRIERAYAEYKREKNVLDYDDLLVRFRDLLLERPLVRERLGARYRNVMVDEYQDTNQIQAEIVELLAGERRSVMAVGDDAQSIYSFRGAHFRNIMDFPNRFEGARIITLEENYRSTGSILELANAVMDPAPERYTKVLRTDRGAGEKPLLIQAPSESTQSRFVCQRVLELREEGVPLEEMAVLFRSGFHSFDLEIELARADIPFVKRGGFRFVESAHVKDLLAHLRVARNLSDTVSWVRVLCLLDGVGPKTANRLAERIAGGEAVARVLASAPSRGDSAAAKSAIADLVESLNDDDPAPAAALDRVLSVYEPTLRRRHPDDAPRRMRDLEHLVALAHRYDTVETMLTDFALEPPSDAVDGGLADEDEGRLTLSTVHSAKGLEWTAVFLLWTADGRFPSHQSSADPDAVEEERRLFYVASTRARDLLILSYPIEYYDRAMGLVFAQPSRFIADVPEDVMAPMTLVEEDAW